MDADVLIIGAGAAGLAAAVELTRAGRTVVIVEARDRIGGRIHTWHAGQDEAGPGVPVELGAEFIHGRPEETWDWVHGERLCTYEVVDEHWVLEGARLKRVEDFWERLDRVMGKLEGEKKRDRSFDEFAREYCAGDEALPLARSYVEGFNAADARRVSTRSLAESAEASEEIEGDRLFRFEAGYDTLVRAMYAACEPSRVRVSLSAAVKEVRWAKGRVEAIVEGLQSPVVARQAVVTLPLGVWQVEPPEVGAVQFVPELPEKREAARRLAMGAVVKVMLWFDEAFWLAEDPAKLKEKGEGFDLAFLHGPGLAFETFWTARPLRVPMITAWVGGPGAERFAGVGDEAIVEAAIGSLAEMTGWSGDSLRKRLSGSKVANWRTDPLTRGAYSYEPVGSAGAMEALAEPVEQTLFFAGEATQHEGLSGTVAGAIASGRRVAREIASP